MSAALVSQTTQQHVLKDDLESLIYVLLWVALMCSETSNPEQAVLFLKTVLDQQPFGGLGPGILLESCIPCAVHLESFLVQYLDSW